MFSITERPSLTGNFLKNRPQAPEKMCDHILIFILLISCSLHKYNDSAYFAASQKKGWRKRKRGDRQREREIFVWLTWTHLWKSTIRLWGPGWPGEFAKKTRPKCDPTHFLPKINPPLLPSKKVAPTLCCFCHFQINSPNQTLAQEAKNAPNLFTLARAKKWVKWSAKNSLLLN
jgi:hypothetical protein